jgi:hypothetical protein
MDIDQYVDMGVQFSRGCPFKCEFCDITLMLGNRVRTKTPEQVFAELPVADGALDDAITAAAPYDLIIANVLAGPLVSMAPELAAIATPGATIGGTPTSGPPGTGGTAGGPALGNR